MISPAVKLPLASRLTIVFAVLALVAALARFAPDATFAAVTPPTCETTVAAWVPVTSPESVPVKLVAVVAVVAVVADVAVVALPNKLPVISPATKLPPASRLTIVFAVFEDVAALARIVAAFTFAAVDPPTVETTVAPCVPVTSPASAPVKLVDVAAVVADVAVVALPNKLPVISPAVKLPPASRLTIVFAVLALVAALARFAPDATFAAVTPPTCETTSCSLGTCYIAGKCSGEVGGCCCCGGGCC